MITRKCDSCGKKMTSWLTVDVDFIGWTDIDIVKLMPYRSRREYCPECFLRMKSRMEEDA